MRRLLLLSLCCLALLSVVSGNRCSRRNEGQEVTDRCGRECYCENGRLVDCCRIRKDFQSMSSKERELYVSTLKKIRSVSRFKKRYDHIVSTHSRLFMKGIHKRIQFLPWHRWFLLEFEDLLHSVDCRVSLPYHDWSLFSGRPWRKASFWKGRPNGLNESIWSDSPRGLGGDGKGGCVSTGKFAKGEWKMTKSGRGRCIKRRFNGKPADIITVQRLLRHSPRRFKRFELELRADLHDGYHCNVGGTMCGLNSANAPEFFLHHCFIDKIWANWQDVGDQQMTAYFDRNSRRLIGARGYSSRDFLDNTYMRSRSRPMCVLYDDPRHPEYHKVVTKLDQQSVSQLMRIKRHKFTPPSSRDLKRLGVGKRERKRAKRLLRNLQPTRTLKSERGFGPIDKAMGFNIKAFQRSSSRGKRMVRVERKNLMRERWRARHRKRRALAVGNSNTTIF